MTRKRVGQGLLEVFSEPCEHCRGRGILVQTDPVDEKRRSGAGGGGNGIGNGGGSSRRDRSGGSRDAKDGGKDTEATPAEETSDVAAEPAAGEPAEGARSGGRRNRGRRNRGQSGEDRVAEDAAVLAGVEPDIEPDTEPDTEPDVEPDVELHGSATDAPAEPGEPAGVELTDSAATDHSPAESNAVQIVPPLEDTVPAVAEEPAVDTTGAESITVDSLPVEPAPAVARPRRRRAASRPAGPPV
jgi:ribonuclease E